MKYGIQKPDLVVSSIHLLHLAWLRRIYTFYICPSLWQRHERPIV